MGIVSDLIGRVKHDASRSAFAGLMGRYFSRQVRQASRLQGGAAGAQDPEDVAAEAFWELWRVLSEDRPLGNALTDTASLLKALAILTRDRTGRARRHATSQCRDFRRTVRLADQGPGEGGMTLHELGRDPWPAHLCALNCREAVERMTNALPRDELRRLVRLWLRGLSLREIAGELGCCERTVQRLYAEVGDLWRSLPEARGLLDEA